MSGFFQTVVRVSALSLLLVGLFFGLASADYVQAIGLSPAKQFVDVVPGEVRRTTFTMSLIPQQQDLPVKISTRSVEVLDQNDDPLPVDTVTVLVPDEVIVSSGESRSVFEVEMLASESAPYGATYEVVFDITQNIDAFVAQGAQGVIEGMVVESLPESLEGVAALQVMRGDQSVDMAGAVDIRLEEEKGAYIFESALFMVLSAVFCVSILLYVLWRVRVKKRISE